MAADVFTVPDDDLPYDPYDEQSILEHALKLPGRTIWNVAEELGYEPILKSTNQGKGKVGDLVEAWFKMAPNPRPEADLPCGVELKVAPLKQNKGGSYGSKERMVLGMIPFHDIVKEEWEEASIRHKFERILFVVYLHDFEEHAASTFQAAFLWSPPAKDLPQIRIDWTTTRDTVREGRAHELTESLGRIMGPCTKGQGSKKKPKADLATQPCNPGMKAKRRAFAFKGGYAWTQVQKVLNPDSIISASAILEEDAKQLTLDDDTLFNETGQTRIQAVEAALLARFHGYQGLSIGELCESLEIPVTGSDKSLAARLLNAVLGVDQDAIVEELAEEGVQVKTVHARTPGSGKTKRAKDLYPFEAMSFPAIDFDEFLEEDWDKGTAQFPEEIQRLLIVPTLSPDSDDKQEERVIGKAFFWSPTRDQMDRVESDWKEIQAIVMSGGAAERVVHDADGKVVMRKTAKREIPKTEQDLPGEREGHALHLRPHTGDADDKVAVPGGEITRQCLWFNKHFIHNLLLASLGDEPAIDGITI